MICCGSNKELICQGEVWQTSWDSRKTHVAGLSRKEKTAHRDFQIPAESLLYINLRASQCMYVTKISETQEEASTKTGGNNTQHSTQL